MIAFLVLCWQILDPVRVSLVCSGPAHMLEVARWFTDESALLEPLLSVCRIKNKFALGQDQLVGGYRDLMLCVLTENPDGLCIIGEIQVTTHSCS